MSDERAVRVEDLLAHRQWVRALARRLAADESRADDLEQATWLAAVENPPVDPRSLRGWLGAVLRNLHRNSVRGDVRRGRREESAARREAAETADDLVAEAEVQHLLVREVLELDEPYRSTVLLRWFDDLTTQQVAKRQGVPLETVRTRLKRAVERLRARMDAHHGGDRRAWSLLLLGRGEGRGPGAATAIGTKAALTGAAGGMAMGLATKLTFAATALVAAGLFWWARSEGAAPAGTETAGAPPTASMSEHRERGHDDTTARAAAAVDHATVDHFAGVDRDRDLHGVVVLADETPVVGAEVQAIDYPWRRTGTQSDAANSVCRPVATTTSGAAGAFSLRLARGTTAFLRVSADGLAIWEIGEFQAGERVRITMTAAVTLQVTMHDDAGAPVADAALWLSSFNSGGKPPQVNAVGTTDAAGECEFGGLPGGTRVLLAPLAGVLGGVEYVDLPEQGATSIELVSSTARTLRGRVFDAISLAPVADARICVGVGFPCAARTDGGGRFELRGFEGKDEKQLEILAEGFAPSVVGAGAGDAIEVPLRRGFTATPARR